MMSMNAQTEKAIKNVGERLVPEYIQDDDQLLITLEKYHRDRYSWAATHVKNKSVLDIACGSGYGSDMLINSGAQRVSGCDIEPEVIAYAKSIYSYPNLSFHVQDILSCDQGPFDVITSFETVEHIDDLSAYFDKIKQLLKPGGDFFISASTSPTASLYRYHVHDFDSASFKKTVTEHGFKICNEKRYIDHFNPKMVRRAMKNHSDSNPPLLKMLLHPFHYTYLLFRTLVTRGMAYENYVLHCVIESSETKYLDNH